PGTQASMMLVWCQASGVTRTLPRARVSGALLPRFRATRATPLIAARGAVERLDVSYPQRLIAWRKLVTAADGAGLEGPGDNGSGAAHAKAAVDPQAHVGGRVGLGQRGEHGGERGPQLGQAVVSAAADGHHRCA